MTRSDFPEPGYIAFIYIFVVIVFALAFLTSCDYTKILANDKEKCFSSGGAEFIASSGRSETLCIYRKDSL